MYGRAERPWGPDPAEFQLPDGSVTESLTEVMAELMPRPDENYSCRCDPANKMYCASFSCRGGSDLDA